MAWRQLHANHASHSHHIFSADSLALWKGDSERAVKYALHTQNCVQKDLAVRLIATKGVVVVVPPSCSYTVQTLSKITTGASEMSLQPFDVAVLCLVERLRHVVTRDPAVAFPHTLPKLLSKVRLSQECMRPPPYAASG